MYEGSGKPRYLIVSDLPLRAPPGAARQVMGIEWMLRRRHFHAGAYAIGYQSCDNSSAATGAHDEARCTANAKAWSSDASVLGEIGPYNSGCAAVEIPIANAASGGALAMIGTATTDPELTAKTPGGQPGTPEKWYPAGTRNFVRLSAPDQFQAAAVAQIARSHRLGRIVVLDDGEPYGTELATWFESDARKLGLHIVDTASWNPKAAHYPGVVAGVAAAQPDGVFLAGYAFLHGTEVLKELRPRLAAGTIFISSDGFADAGEDSQEAGPAANGLLTVWAGVQSRDAGPLGRSLLRVTGADPVQQYGALYGAAAASVLLDAIARSDGSRASVTKQLFHAHTPAGLIGRFGFDADGDPTVGAMTVLRVKNGTAALEPTEYPTATLAKG